MIIELSLVAIGTVYLSYLIGQRPVNKFKVLGIVLMLIGLLVGTPATTLIYQDSVTLENPETVDGIENIRQYDKSEPVKISEDKTVVVIVDSKVEKIIIQTEDGKELEELERGRNRVNENKISKYDRVILKTVGWNGRIIDSEAIEIKS